MDWQSIASAPKDGTHILAANSNGDCAVIYWTGFGWIPAFVHLDHDTAFKMWNDSSGAFWSGQAAYWMPIPKRPALTSATPPAAPDTKPATHRP